MGEHIPGSNLCTSDCVLTDDGRFWPKWDRQLVSESAPARVPIVERRILIIEKGAAVHGECHTPERFQGVGDSLQEPRASNLRSQGDVGDRFESYAQQILEIIQEISR